MVLGRRGGNWIGEQMRSTIAKPDVLRLLIPDMADSIIHRFANSSNIRAGAAIAASQPPSAWHSTYARLRMYYITGSARGCTCRSRARKHAHTETRVFVRSHANGPNTHICTWPCTFKSAFARVRPSAAPKSAFNLAIDDDGDGDGSAPFSSFPRPPPSAAQRHSGIRCQLSRITETAPRLPGMFARPPDPPPILPLPRERSRRARIPANYAEIFIGLRVSVNYT